MAEVKSIRVRPINANLDERLGEVSNNTGLKGGLSDVKVTIFEETNSWSE